MKRIPSDTSLIDDLFSQYVKSHRIDDLVLAKQVRDFLVTYFEKIKYQFDNPDAKTFLSLSEKYTAELRGKYGKFSDCCANKGVTEIISKFRRVIYIEFEKEMDAFFKSKQDKNSIDTLSGMLNAETVRRLKKMGIETVPQLLSLSREDLSKFWNPNETVSNHIVKALYLIGYCLSDEATFGVVYDNGVKCNFFYDFEDFIEVSKNVHYDYVASDDLEYDEHNLTVHGKMCKSLKR